MEAARKILDLGIEIRWHGEIVALEMGDDSFLELLPDKRLEILTGFGYVKPVTAVWGIVLIVETQQRRKVIPVFGFCQVKT